MLKFPKFIGHRGAAGFAPENTLVSMRVAKECGAQMVEFDVKHSADNHLIIMHDSKVDRTTNGTGNVLDMSLAELKKLDAGSWFDSSFAHTTIPTLKEMFDVLKELNLSANIEIKPCPGTDEPLAKMVLSFVEKFWPKSLPAPLLSSFSIQALKTVRECSTKIALGLILDNPPDANWKVYAKELKASAISVSHYSLKNSDLVNEIHSLKIPALAYTINDQKRADELYKMGVDSVFTNYPGSIMSR